jgi:glycosyltransferase involved in cell wall biosynthesis
MERPVMKKLLHARLKQKDWEYKAQRYMPVFDRVEERRPATEPYLSVIVISYRLHPNTIVSFQELSRQKELVPFELIFVDNGGQPEEFAPLKPYVDCYVRLHQNTGVCISRNIGAVFSRAPLLLFLEDDGIPDPELIVSHLLLHQCYDIVTLRGIYLPCTNEQGELQSPNYYLGARSFPWYVSLEGNFSIASQLFFQAGGWNDNLFFGVEGLDLSLRLLQIEPDKRKYMYSPIPVIYHNFYRGDRHFAEKHRKQMEALRAVRQRFPGLDRHLAEWRDYFQQEQALHRTGSESWSAMEQLRERIFVRNRVKIDLLRGNAFSIHDEEGIRLLHLRLRKEGRHCAIFGAGELGALAWKVLSRQGVPVSCFYDNDPAKKGLTVGNVEVRHASEIRPEDFIVIASVWAPDIAKQLVSLGFREGDDFVVMR